MRIGSTGGMLTAGLEALSGATRSQSSRVLPDRQALLTALLGSNPKAPKGVNQPSAASSASDLFDRSLAEVKANAKAGNVSSTNIAPMSLNDSKAAIARLPRPTHQGSGMFALNVPPQPKFGQTKFSGIMDAVNRMQTLSLGASGADKDNSADFASLAKAFA